MQLELVELPNLAPDYVPAPPRWFRPFWMYCRVTNKTSDNLFVYGPRHESAKTTIPTSLYILRTGQRTPRFWDCKGIFVPSGSSFYIEGSSVRGPVALKFRDFRRVTVKMINGTVTCSRPNQIVGSEQDHFPVPEHTVTEVLSLPRHMVEIPINERLPQFW